MSGAEQVWERTRDGRTERVHVPLQLDPWGQGRIAMIAERFLPELLGDAGWTFVEALDDTTEPA